MDFAIPELGEGVYEAEFVQWLVGVGDTVKRGQNLMEVLTDKATMEVPSPFAGKVTALKLEPGQPFKVGDVALTYEPAGTDGAAAEDKPAAKPAATAKADGKAPVATAGRGNGHAATGQHVKAAPSVRLMARKLGIDLDRVRGSGPEGRILVEDLTRHVAPAAEPAKREPGRPQFDLGRPGTRVKMQGLRRKIAEQMVRSKRAIPHYAYVDECDVTDLVRLRDALKAGAARKSVKLTYLAFIVKAVAAALREVPVVNATYDEDAGEVVLHDRYHVGVAVAGPQGLIVPVIRNADRKDVFEIARDIERLGSDARAGRNKLEDLKGGTFTVTSVGGIGGLISTPVINHPEVGILGVGKVVKRPVYDDAERIVPAQMLYLSFSFDHRVVDGAVGAVFGNAVIARLTNPAEMLVGKDEG